MRVLRIFPGTLCCMFSPTKNIGAHRIAEINGIRVLL